MTIAATVFCKDGVVMCADTEESITDDRKGKTSKIELIYDSSTKKRQEHIFTRISDSPVGNEWFMHANWIIGVAGAGHSDWISVFISGLRERIFQKIGGQKLEFHKLQECLEEYTEAYFSKYIRSYAEEPQNRPQAHMLVVAQTKSKWPGHAYRISDNVVLSDQWGHSVAVGKGAPIFQHLADDLLRNSYDYDLRQAASIAVYVMRRVKSEVPGCGGHSHIVMISSKGKIQQLTTRRIMELELHYEELENKMHRDFAAELIKELP